MISDRTPVLSPGVPRFGGSPPSPSALPRSSARRSREQLGMARVGAAAQREGTAVEWVALVPASRQAKDPHVLLLKAQAFSKTAH